MFFRQVMQAATMVVSTGALVLGLTPNALAFGQEQPRPSPPQQQYPQPNAGPANSGTWSPVGQDSSGSQTQQPVPYNQGNGPASNGSSNQGGQYGGYPNQAPYGQPGYGNQSGNYPQQQNGYPQQNPVRMPPAAIPSQLTVPAGTFITVRVNQLLSSDHNQAGDAFSASLVQPLVINGVVIAEPGQTIGGRIVEAQKAGRVEGTSRLRIQLTEVTLVDGQQVPLVSQLVSRNGGTSIGRDAGAIAGTTGLGAAIGAAAGWGTGAAIGAGAGAVVGTVGVLLTRGRPSIISPEQVLTFRIEAPVSIDTTRSAQAFRYVQPNEYDRPVYNQQPAPYAGYNPPVVVAAAPYYGYGYPSYYPYGYGYGYGPGFSLFFGSGYYRRPYYGGRGYYGGGFGHRR